MTPGLPNQLADELGLPCFVKPANMGSSVGVSKATTVEELRDAIAHALTYDEWVVVEEAVVGREIEVAVIGNTDPFVSIPGEIIPGDEFYSYDDKYVNDASVGLVPAALSDDEVATVRQLALDVYRALRCEGLARCDFFFEDRPGGRGFLCNEVNTMPGFTPISMFPKMLIASGMTYPEIIDRLVELALERHRAGGATRSTEPPRHPSARQRSVATGGRSARLSGTCEPSARRSAGGASRAADRPAPDRASVAITSAACTASDSSGRWRCSRTPTSIWAIADAPVAAGRRRSAGRSRRPTPRRTTAPPRTSRRPAYSPASGCWSPASSGKYSDSSGRATSSVVRPPPPSLVGRWA